MRTLGPVAEIRAPPPVPGDLAIPTIPPEPPTALPPGPPPPVVPAVELLPPTPPLLPPTPVDPPVVPLVSVPPLPCGSSSEVAVSEVEHSAPKTTKANASEQHQTGRSGDSALMTGLLAVSFAHSLHALSPARTSASYLFYRNFYADIPIEASRSFHARPASSPSLVSPGTMISRTVS